MEITPPNKLVFNNENSLFFIFLISEIEMFLVFDIVFKKISSFSILMIFPFIIFESSNSIFTFLGFICG